MNILLLHWPPKKPGQRGFGEVLDPDSYSIDVLIQLFGEEIWNADEFLVIDIYTIRMFIRDRGKRLPGRSVYAFDPAVADHFAFAEAVIRCTSPPEKDGRMPTICSFGLDVDEFWDSRFAEQEMPSINGIVVSR